jgi:hypothetical protein
MPTVVQTKEDERRRTRCGLDYTIFPVEVISPGPVSPDNLILTGSARWPPSDDQQMWLMKFAQVLANHPCIDCDLPLSVLTDLIQRFVHDVVTEAINTGKLPAETPLCLDRTAASQALQEVLAKTPQERESHLLKVFAALINIELNVALCGLHFADTSLP